MDDASSIGRPFPTGTQRRRPEGLKPPAHLSPSPAVPEPAPAAQGEEHGGPKGEEPTRYGDWEKKGICWDF